MYTWSQSTIKRIQWTKEITYSRDANKCKHGQTDHRNEVIDKKETEKHIESDKQIYIQKHG